jgi:hypothetical protein
MPGLLAVSTGILRFAGAAALGMFLLIALQFVLLFAGPGLRDWSGATLPLGLLLILVMSLRLAVRGNVTRIDRTVGTAAAGISAIALVFVLIVAGTILAVALLLSLVFLLGGGAQAAAALFGPVIIIAGAIFGLAGLAARGFAYAAYRLWLPHRPSRRLGFATFVALFIAVLLLFHFG